MWGLSFNGCITGIHVSWFRLKYRSVHKFHSFWEQKFMPTSTSTCRNLHCVPRILHNTGPSAPATTASSQHHGPYFVVELRDQIDITFTTFHAFLAVSGTICVRPQYFLAMPQRHAVRRALHEMHSTELRLCVRQGLEVYWENDWTFPVDMVETFQNILH